MTGFIPSGGFDATTVPPEQGGSKHPIGMFPFVIKNTLIKSSRDEKSGMLEIEFESPVGTIKRNYNLWHENPQTVEIANKQLSALCHVTGQFRLNWQNQGRELVGSRGTMEVGWQKGEEPSQEKPQGGYVEVKKVFDQQGNEPGKVAAAPQPQQAGNNWGGAQPQGQAQPSPQQASQPQQFAPQQAPTSWGAGNQQPAPNPPAQQPQQNTGPSWGQGAAPQQSTPPWGRP